MKEKKSIALHESILLDTISGRSAQVVDDECGRPCTRIARRFRMYTFNIQRVSIPAQIAKK
jgi:hypothetical protein